MSSRVASGQLGATAIENTVPSDPEQNMSHNIPRALQLLSLKFPLHETYFTMDSAQLNSLSLLQEIQLLCSSPTLPLRPTASVQEELFLGSD